VDPESIAPARAVGEQVLLDEHRCFVDEGADNSEHVPRVARIAESVRCALERGGCGAADAELVKRGLLDLGRALFVEEWMDMPIPVAQAPGIHEWGLGGCTAGGAPARRARRPRRLRRPRRGVVRKGKTRIP